ESMKVRNTLIVVVLLLFLCGIASAAGNSHSYGKSKSGVMFQSNFDTGQVTIEKNQHSIKISNEEHSETKIKISKSDIDTIIGNSDLIRVVHTNDAGVNDWERVVVPNYENGYLELDVEFSTVTITPYVSQVKNYMFESWTGSPEYPTDWVKGSYDGGFRQGVYSIGDGNNSYGIFGDGTSPRGLITQATTLPAGTYTVGAWFFVNGRTSGAMSVDLESAGRLYVNSNTGSVSEFTYYETQITTTAANPNVRVYADTTPNTGSFFRIDGLIVSPAINPITATETNDAIGQAFYQTFDYTPAAVYSSSVLQTDFKDYDITEHGKYSAVATIDDTLVNCYVEGEKIYVDTSGLSTSSHEVLIQVLYNKAPTMISPSNGLTITREFPPLYADQVFVWEDSGTTCQIQVAEDSAFSNVVYSHETTTATATASLAAGTYYWRVRSYDPIYHIYGDYPDEYNFVIVTTTGSVSGTGIAGCVYESQGLGNYQVVSGALATIYNDTYSVTKTTGSEGYYQVLGLSNGTYYVSVKKTGYDASDITPVDVTDSEVTVQNIAIQASQSYFAPTDCVIKVKEHWYSFSGVSGVTYAYYQNGDTATLGTGTTDSTGRFTMSDIDIGVRYKIVLTTDDGTQTDYIMPSSSELSFIIVLDITETSLLPDSQFYDVVNVSVDKEILNSTAAKVTVSWNGTDSSMTGVYYQIGQTANNGTFVVLDDYTETPTGTLGSHSFVVSNYLGESYKIIVEFTEDSFGEVEKAYTVTFAGSTIPFIGGKALSYFGVFLVFIVAMMFGKAEHAMGGLMVCGFSWFLWYLDVFTGFGTATNTTMAAGLIIGTVFALLAAVNEARKGANI
ncbi:MAG: carboxypeptidase-like regulatory domain-containing protein, partial [Clostridia bacterium]|nr:carboxypeptidase-like regulatory domain-containing protein [Clostridia bacterium]